jgi:hypothetical protein
MPLHKLDAAIRSPNRAKVHESALSIANEFSWPLACGALWSCCSRTGADRNVADPLYNNQYLNVLTVDVTNLSPSSSGLLVGAAVGATCP